MIEESDTQEINYETLVDADELLRDPDYKCNLLLNDYSLLDEKDDEPEMKQSPMKISGRQLFGLLHPAGRPWISFNAGLMVVTCNCEIRRAIDSKKTFSEIQQLVTIFSDSHIGCDPLEKTAAWKM